MVNERPKKNIEYITIDENGKEHLNLHILIESLLTLSMGTTLDMGRLAIQHPEAFKQFERTIKDTFYDKIEFAKKILDRHGYKDYTKE